MTPRCGPPFSTSSHVIELICSNPPHLLKNKAVFSNTQKHLSMNLAQTPKISLVVNESENESCERPSFRYAESLVRVTAKVVETFLGIFPI